MSTAQETPLASWQFSDAETQTLLTFVRADGEYIKAGCQRDGEKWLPVLDGHDAGLGLFDNVRNATDAIIAAYCGERSFAMTDAAREILRTVPACDACSDTGYVDISAIRCRFCLCQKGRDARRRADQSDFGA